MSYTERMKGKRGAPSKGTEARTARVVGFKVSADTVELLEALQRDGESLNQCARRLLLDHISAVGSE